VNRCARCGADLSRYTGAFCPICGCQVSASGAPTANATAALFGQAPPKRCRGKRWAVWAVAGLLVVAGVGTGIFFLVRGTGGGGEESVALFPIAVGDKWGYIDKTGTMVIQPRFDEIASFSAGLALVCLDDADDTWAYIDKTGKVVWQSE
jgi:hypothetical protein